MKTKLLLMLLAVGFVAGAAQANMLANPGFEEGTFSTDPGTYPPGWSLVSASYTSAYTWLSDTGSHSGTKYMRIQPWYASPSYTPSIFQPEVTGVIAGEDYEFSVWSKNGVEGDTNQEMFRIQWLDTAGVMSSHVGDIDVTSTEWTQLDFGTYTAPEGAIAASFRISVNGYNPSATYIDDAGMYGPGDIQPVRFPVPYIGEDVPTGDVVLSWRGPDPNTTGDDVYVDVWFGADPNKPPLGSFTKVLSAGVNETSVTVNDLDEGTYYWQVNSYIYGSATGDPIEGPLWSFNAVGDLPPSSVDVGVDMITWSGKPVSLDATVEDDGKSALTYLWSAAPADGVVFDPSAYVEDPMVTITKDPASIPIVNAGFEDPVLADGDYTEPAPGWGSVGNYFAGLANAGLPGTSYPGYGGDAPEGDNIGISGVEVDGDEFGLAQVLTETLAADTTYELTVEVGNIPLYDWGGYKVQLLAGGTVLAEDDNSLTIAEDTFETVTVTHTSSGVSDPNVGLPLEIRLLAIGHGVYTEVNFDDLKLTADPPPSSSSAITVRLTLAVNDALGSVDDTMAIDVYDDACKAARIGLSRAAENPADFDANCITDLKDLAAMLTVWLKNTELTEIFEILP